MSDVEHYIKILEKHDLNNAREEFENMLIVDYLVMNTDRHMKNFGIIRDVNTLQWKRLTPIFDTGESMQNHKVTAEMNFKDDVGKLFTNTAKSFSSYLDLIKSKDRVDFTSLKNISSELKTKLIEYQKIIGIDDLRIEKIVKGLEYRIISLM
jgi:hypothetical protein